MTAKQIEELVNSRYPKAYMVSHEVTRVENGVVVAGFKDEGNGLEDVAFVIEDSILPGAEEPLIPRIVQWFQEEGERGFSALVDAGIEDGRAMGLNGQYIAKVMERHVFDLVFGAAMGVIAGMLDGGFVRYKESNVKLPDGRILSFALCRSDDATPASDMRKVGVMCRAHGWDLNVESLPDFVARKLEGAK